ncbi:MAG: FeoA family protein [Halanaerobiales bacterium]
MTLADIKQGEEFEITRVPDEKTRIQALRFGLTEGARLGCAGKVPGGPVIVKRNLQEIAVGRNLARNIEVNRVVREEVS